MRNFINAAGYICFFAGGTEAIFGFEKILNQRFWQWCTLLGMVIFTTVHAQDFQDQEGDKESGKLTLPLLLGDGVKGKLSVAAPVLAWSISVPWSLGASVESRASVFEYLFTTSCGMIVCYKVFKGQDQATWRSMYRWYNLWVMALIALPPFVVYEPVNRL